MAGFYPAAIMAVLAANSDSTRERCVTSESEPWTIGRLIEWTANFLKDSGVDAPRLATDLLLADSLGCERLHL